MYMYIICRGGSRDFEKGWRSMPSFRWSKKAKITLETSFGQNIFISIFKFSQFSKLANEILSISQNLQTL